jgi:hypothetical protein
MKFRIDLPTKGDLLIHVALDNVSAKKLLEASKFVSRSGRVTDALQFPQRKSATIVLKDKNGRFLRTTDARRGFIVRGDGSITPFIGEYEANFDARISQEEITSLADLARQEAIGTLTYEREVNLPPRANSDLMALRVTWSGEDLQEIVKIAKSVRMRREEAAVFAKGFVTPIDWRGEAANVVGYGGFRVYENGVAIKWINRDGTEIKIPQLISLGEIEQVLAEAA